MPAGRPQKKIDERQFRALCALQCTLPEFAAVFGCGQATIERWCKRTYGKSFGEVFKEYEPLGKISVRRGLDRLVGVNASVTIFMAKQRLGMSDNPVTDGESESMQAIGRLNDLFTKARSNYGSGAASSPVEPEQAGAEHEGGSIPADAAPLSAAKQGRKSAKPSAKGKAPAKAVKSK